MIKRKLDALVSYVHGHMRDGDNLSISLDVTEKDLKYLRTKFTSVERVGYLGYIKFLREPMPTKNPATRRWG